LLARKRPGFFFTMTTDPSTADSHRARPAICLEPISAPGLRALGLHCAPRGLRLCNNFALHRRQALELACRDSRSILVSLYGRTRIF
jgi:hypothetical protein